jgi:plastocyanin
MMFSRLTLFSAVIFSSFGRADDAKPDTGWATLRGKITWAKSDAPPVGLKAKVDPGNQDFKVCTKNGEIPDETIVVDPKTMSVANVFVYFKKIEPEDIHPSYPKTAEDVAKRDAEQFQMLNKMSLKEAEDGVKSGKVNVGDLKASAMIDQPDCRYFPHALFCRVGQTVLVKNGDTIGHNVNFQGLEDANRENLNMPAKSIVTKKLVPELHPIQVTCNVHPWMNMRVLVLEHPYAAVTNAQGEFVIKNVKPGSHTIVVRNADGLYLNGREGRSIKVTLKADEVNTFDIKWEK